MKFSVDWISEGQNASPEERATLCALDIEVGDRKVSAHRDQAAQEYFDSIVLPAVHLAEGIASNWWKIFGSRDVPHRVLPWRTGFALPDLSFEFDGSRFAVSCESLETTNPALLFFESSNEWLSRSEAEDVFRAFINSVVSRLSEENVTESELQLAWARVLHSMGDSREKTFCEAAGALGVDPYAISESDADFIEQSGELFAAEALLEFLAGVGADIPESPDQRLNLLGWIRQLQLRYNSRLPELGAIAERLNQEMTDGVSPPVKDGADLLPWTRGYRAARAFREAISLKGTQAVSVKKVAEKLGGAHFARKKGPSGPPAVYAVVARQENDIHVHLRDRGRQTWAKNAETFAFARAIGDAVLFPQTPLSTINGLHRAERQAEGRAFAAEFVAPRDTVLEMHREGRDVDEIAWRLEVNPKVVDHQIENSAYAVA